MKRPTSFAEEGITELLSILKSSRFDVGLSSAADVEVRTLRSILELKQSEELHREFWAMGIVVR